MNTQRAPQSVKHKGTFHRLTLSKLRPLGQEAAEDTDRFLEQAIKSRLPETAGASRSGGDGWVPPAPAVSGRGVVAPSVFRLYQAFRWGGVGSTGPLWGPQS